MRADFPVLLDANVVATYSLFDFYLRLAEGQRLLLPKWSDKILREAKNTYETKLKKKWEPERVDRMFAAANEAFPEALIVGYEKLEPVCENDEKDRHVLAAAIRGKVQTVVTFNLKDFRKEHLEPWDVIAAHPGEYLITLYGHNKGIVVDRINDVAKVRGTEPEAALASLGRVVPTFSAYVAEDLGWDI